MALFHTADNRPIRVLAYDGGHWRETAALGIMVDGTIAQDHYSFWGTKVATADVTGDGRPDFLVVVEGGDNNPGVVVSQEGANLGSWRPISATFKAGPQQLIARSPAFIGNQLISYYNDCAPNCAEGHTSPVVWKYVPATGMFATNSAKHY